MSNTEEAPGIGVIILLCGLTVVYHFWVMLKGLSDQGAMDVVEETS